VALLAGACGKDGKSTPVIPANATPEERVIIQARAALGPEDKLDAVNSLVLSGNVSDSKNQPVGQIVIMFKKPARQYSELRTTDQALIIQGSDGMEGWILGIDKNTNKTLTVLKAPDEMQNTYMSMENLFFFRASEHVRGATVSLDGEAQYRGIPCWKISFHYPDSFTYVRYIDKTTNQLRGTVLNPIGAEFVEEGDTTVDGIIFPAVLHEYNKSGDLVQSIKFDKIMVNQPLSDGLFEMPSLTDLYKSATAAKPKTTATPPPPASAATPPPPLLPSLKPN
jgi:outer membrane lipoprotein-sorting protein